MQDIISLGLEAMSILGIFVMPHAYSMHNIVLPLNKHLYWWIMSGSPSQWHTIAEKTMHEISGAQWNKHTLRLDHGPLSLCLAPIPLQTVSFCLRLLLPGACPV